MSEQEEKKFVITETLLSNIVGYLVRCPYADVEHLMTRIRQVPQIVKKEKSNAGPTIPTTPSS